MADTPKLAPAGSPEELLVRRIDMDRLPRHVAIIMDGNGRWAKSRNLPRVEGHRAGVASVRDTVEASAQLGLEVLTLYAFSVENWKRPRFEVWTLMNLLKEYVRKERETLIENAERFGLAQLHQLRGRIGRGGHKSYCILIPSTDDPEEMEKLAIMERTTNGFEIAEADLRFHKAVGRASGNAMMRSLSAVIETALVASFRMSSPVNEADEHKASVRGHAKIVDAIIPPNTAVPSAFCPAAPAPFANTSGTTPKMNANDVIKMGRNRKRAASTAASKIDLPSFRKSRANSTIKMAFLLASAMMSTIPICV